MNPEVGSLSDDELEQHFDDTGWKKNDDPSPFFSVRHYHEHNPDVADAGLNPFQHFLVDGSQEGRTVSLSTWGKTDGIPMSLEDLQLCKSWIDIGVIRDARPDLDVFGDDVIVSWFMARGWCEGVEPCPAFSFAYYTEKYQDVLESGIFPLLHYIKFGVFDERFAQQADEDRMVEQLRADMDSTRDYFDAGWYRTTYPDVSGDDEALLAHYIQYGWKEMRDPSKDFSTEFYFENYADIRQNQINPLVHYALYGQKELRKATPSDLIRLGYSPEASLIAEMDGMTYVGHVPSYDKKPRAPRTLDRSALHLHWIVPDFRQGGGGHMTIFRMVRYLELLGHKNTIWIEKPTFHKSERSAWETIVKYFQCVEADVRFVSDELFRTSSDIVIATGWSTAWIANELKGFRARMYFVQDHEPEFYPTGSYSNLARETYSFDMGCICASPWLKQLMTDRYGRWAEAFYLGYEPDQYYVSETRASLSSAKARIAVYGRGHTDRRCVQLAIAGLELLAQERQDFEVHFFGEDQLPFNEAPFEAYNHGVLPAEKLNALYNDCHLGVCFSGTNYSLVPQEMMACGLPLVEFNTESTQVIFPKSTVTLAGPNPADIAKKIGKLLDNPQARAKQSAAALKWVKGFSWRNSAEVVEAAIQSYLDHKKVKPASPSVTRPKDILFDVVVPTWNGKQEFKPVLEALRTQRLADQMQIHCVDSSSSDGTIEWLKDQPDVSLTVIDQKEFQHGRTRNFGASLGQAPIVGFITQDAMPAGRDWATDIVKMFKAVPDAAGLFGRHIAYPDHPLFVRDEIHNHFANMLSFPLVLSKHTNPEKWESGDRGWRQLLHFYSDNNSAMRRDVWKEIPYPEVDYGEDQVWARDIIEAGYSKIYAPTAAVFHSHDYDPAETYKRSKTEGAFFYEHFGYRLGDGSPEEIAERVKREQANFRAWAKLRAVDPAEVEMRQQNIAEKYRGWRDGVSEVAEA